MQVVLWRHTDGGKTVISGLVVGQARRVYDTHCDLLDHPLTNYYRVTLHSDHDRIVHDSYIDQKENHMSKEQGYDPTVKGNEHARHQSTDSQGSPNSPGKTAQDKTPVSERLRVIQAGARVASMKTKETK